jgi:thioesterase domain-containing protein
MASGTKRNLAADRVPVEKLVSLPISRHMVGLIEKYHPQPVVDVTIDLFRELDSYQTHAHPLHAWETNHLPDGGWSRWVLNQPGIYWLPGDHWNIVKPPAVSALAQSIRATMDRHLKLAAPATAPNRSR